MVVLAFLADFLLLIVGAVDLVEGEPHLANRVDISPLSYGPQGGGLLHQLTRARSHPIGSLAL